MFAAAMLCAVRAQATVTRTTFLDQNSQLVSDDYDIYTFPHLAPMYSNTFFVSMSPTVWASIVMDAGVLGTVGIQTNKPYTQTLLFDNLNPSSPVPNPVGFVIQDIPNLPGGGSAITAADSADTSTDMVVPDDKLILLWGKDLGKVQVGALFEWAEQDRSSTWNFGNNGQPLAYPILTSSPVSGITGKAFDLYALDNRQSSDSFRLTPSFGLLLGKVAVDVAAFGAYNSLSSSHEEQSIDIDAMDTYTDAWQDTGRMSFGGTVRGTVPLDDKNRVVLVGSYSNQDLSLVHQYSESVQGTFTTAQLNYLNDSWTTGQQLYTVGTYDLSAGWVANLNERTLFVFGVSLQGSNTDYEYDQYSIVNAYPTSNRDDTYTSQILATQVQSFGIPFVGGIEYEASPWLKLRATMGRYLVGGTATTITNSIYNPNHSVASTAVESYDNANINWVVGLGMSVVWGQFGLDAGAAMESPNLTNSQPSDTAIANVDLTFKF